MTHQNKSFILFDGICVLCNTFVSYIIKKDRSEMFMFGTLQGTSSSIYLKNFGLEPKKMESVVLVHHDEVYLKSRAVLKIVELLPFGFHKVLLIGRILPLKWTDKMYDGVAYIRYRIFGKKATCTVPDEQVRHRYIV